jgi:hypothetical protein
MTAPDNAFLCRLLCAAEASYGILPRKPFQREQPYYDRVGFVGEPTVVQAGSGDINAALVGLSQDGIVVAFRGTLPPKVPLTVPVLLDWMQDFVAIPKQFPGIPGKIHSGFHRAIAAIWPDLLEAVQSLRASHPSAAIQVTGHSKGGSLASLGAWLLHGQGLAPANVVTFAAAHVGDAQFAAAYSGEIAQIRYENYLDLVPFVPPDVEHRGLLSREPRLKKLFSEIELWDYEPVGTLRYIEKDGTVIGDRFGLETYRIAEILIDIARGEADDVAYAHSLVKYPLGYCRAVCDSGLCGG